MRQFFVLLYLFQSFDATCDIISAIEDPKVQANLKNKAETEWLLFYTQLKFYFESLGTCLNSQKYVRRGGLAGFVCYVPGNFFK